MLAVNPVILAEVTPADVEPLLTNPEEPDPPAPEVLISLVYPLFGAGEAAAQDIVAAVFVIAEAITEPGEEQPGIVQAASLFFLFVSEAHAELL